jgi:hypothetical protein
MIIYAAVLLSLILTFALWVWKQQSKYVRLLFWIGGFSLAVLVPQAELKTDDTVRFICINFAVFSLLILYSANFSTYFGERAVLLTMTTIWQLRIVVLWFYSELKDYFWVWDTAFHLLLVGTVGILQYKFKIEKASPLQVTVELVRSESVPTSQTFEKFLRLLEDVQSGVVVTQ